MLTVSAWTGAFPHGAVDRACTAELAKRMPGWRLAAVVPEVERWTREHGQHPTAVHGDFDGDGLADVALLVQDGAQAVLDYPRRLDVVSLVICLTRPPAAAVHVVTRPYCADYIELAAKGARYHDFDRNTEGRFPRDGVRAVCFEKASATYLYDGSTFRMVVDGD